MSQISCTWPNWIATQQLARHYYDRRAPDRQLLTFMQCCHCYRRKYLAFENIFSQKLQQFSPLDTAVRYFLLATLTMTDSWCLGPDHDRPVLIIIMIYDRSTAPHTLLFSRDRQSDQIGTCIKTYRARCVPITYTIRRHLY